MTRKSNMAFCCSKFRGNKEQNIEAAKSYARFITLCGKSPVVPHLLFPQFLDDNDAEERIKGITLGVDQLKMCDEMWIFGTEISDGMAYEIEEAKKYGIPVRLFDTERKSIDPSTMMIDDRIDRDYRKTVYGLKFV